MIGVSLSQLVLVCLGVGVVLVGLWWVIGVAGVRRAETRKYKGVVTCRICSVRYESENEDITVCPACGTPNERQPPGII